MKECFYGFEEGIDYKTIDVNKNIFVIPNALEMNLHQRVRADISTDYALTIPCSKEISMVKGNVKVAVVQKNV